MDDDGQLFDWKRLPWRWRRRRRLNRRRGQVHGRQIIAPTHHHRPEGDGVLDRRAWRRRIARNPGRAGPESAGGGYVRGQAGRRGGRIRDNIGDGPENDVRSTRVRSRRSGAVRRGGLPGDNDAG